MGEIRFVGTGKTRGYLYLVCKKLIFLPMRQSLFYFSGAGKFCLAHGLRQLTRDFKSDIRTLNFRSDVSYLPPWKNTE